MAEQFAVIEFEEYPDEWFRVRVNGVSVREFDAAIETYNESAVRFMPGPIEKLCDLFAPFLESWSRDGDPDVRELDVNLLLALVREWVNGVRNVPLPLPRRSSDGEPSEDPTPNSTSPEN